VAGTSDDGLASFRLRGSDLIITIARRLTPRGFGGRPYVAIVCGEAVRSPTGGDSVLVSRGRRAFRVPPGVRRIRARLDADVADRVDLCRMEWRSAARSLLATAEMRLLRGSRPLCTDPGSGRLVADGPEVSIVNVDGGGDMFESSGAYRACLKASGVWRPLSTWRSGRYGVDHVASHVAVAGTWVAWAWETTHYASQCGLDRVELIAGAVERIAVASPYDAPAFRAGFRCADAIALTSDGRMAWVEHAPSDGDAHVMAQAASGANVELGTAPFGAIADLAISPDGRTVTWRENGVERRAEVT
jgi:hypothetical protein